MKVRRPKCSLCNEEAVISLPYARLNLCKKHLEEFMIKRVKKSGLFSRVVLGLSGGKDSISLAYILRKMGVDILAVTVDSVPTFTTLEAKIAKNFAVKLGIPHIKVYAYELYGFNTLNYKDLKRRPCGLCSDIRNHFLSMIALRTKRVVVTAHNMDDILQTGLTFILTNRIGELRKIKPIEEGVVTKWKPFFYLMERDILAFALSKSFEIVRVRCPLYEVYSTLGDKIKRFLNLLEEEHPSIKLSLLNALMQLSTEKEVPTKRCRFCGLPSYADVCGICKLRLKGPYTRREPLKPIFKLYNTPMERSVLIMGQGEAVWKKAPKRFTVRNLLNSLGIKTTEAVVTIKGEPVPYSTYVEGPWEIGDIVIHLISRVPLPKLD